MEALRYGIARGESGYARGAPADASMDGTGAGGGPLILSKMRARPDGRPEDGADDSQEGSPRKRPRGDSEDQGASKAAPPEAKKTCDPELPEAKKTEPEIQQFFEALKAKASAEAFHVDAADVKNCAKELDDGKKKELVTTWKKELFDDILFPILADRKIDEEDDDSQDDEDQAVGELHVLMGSPALSPADGDAPPAAATVQDDSSVLRQFLEDAMDADNGVPKFWKEAVQTAAKFFSKAAAKMTDKSPEQQLRAALGTNMNDDAEGHIAGFAFPAKVKSGPKTGKNAWHELGEIEALFEGLNVKLDDYDNFDMGYQVRICYMI